MEYVRRAAHCRVRDEVGDRHELAGVRVDESFVPRPSLLVLDLHHVREGGSVVCLDDVLERRRPVVVLSVEKALRLSDCLLDLERRRRRCDFSCNTRATRLATRKRRRERRKVTYSA